MMYWRSEGDLPGHPIGGKGCKVVFVCSLFLIGQMVVEGCTDVQLIPCDVDEFSAGRSWACAIIAFVRCTAGGRLGKHIPTQVSIKHSSGQSLVIVLDGLGWAAVVVVPVCIYFEEGCVLGYVVVVQGLN